jgi:transketolase
MNKIADRQVICDVLMKHAENDKDIFVLCSDSRGSASLTPFADKFPDQFVEMGIAEQSLVTTAAGMASCGRKPFAASPASFLASRSLEQIKVDVAYSHTNVKLIGISGGISYGALGMTHHSTQDIAAISSIPGVRVFLPSDRFLTEWLMENIIDDNEPAYIRVGRNAVDDVYTGADISAEFPKAVEVRKGSDAAIIACGEMVGPAVKASEILEKSGISTSVLDMYCLKPFDTETVKRLAESVKVILTAEEHVLNGGLGSMVCRAVCESTPVKVKCLGLPDEPAIAGKSQEVFDYYGLNSESMADNIRKMLS